MGKPDSAAGFAGLNETVQWDGKVGMSLDEEFCTWSTLGADGTRSVAQLQLGNATSFQQTLAFSYSAAGYTLSSFGIEFPSAAFSGIGRDAEGRPRRLRRADRSGDAAAALDSAQLNTGNK